MIQLHKIIEIDRLVWVDGQPTDQKEKRIMACFKRITNFYDVKETLEFGSMILNRGVTLKQAETALKGADFSNVKFVEPNELGFYKAVV
jgi:late competence protein required for DNA uptake (superfamily II DNA/RNA helicase)